MTEIQLKELLSNYNIMQQQLDILGNCPKDYEGEEVRLEYKKTLFCVNILSSAMGILNEKECLIIDIT